MLCTKCGKYEATTHYKSIINGKVTKEYLCPKCAKEIDMTSFYFPNIFSSLIDSGVKEYNVKRCSCCGSSFEDIKATGFAGCSECYSTFKQEISPSLNLMHGHTKHINVNLENKATSLLQTKKQELQKAILEERFEDAAKLRDEIKDMEKK